MRHARIPIDRPEVSRRRIGLRGAFVRRNLRSLGWLLPVVGVMAGLQQWIAAQFDDQLAALIVMLALAAPLSALLAPAFGTER